MNRYKVVAFFYLILAQIIVNGQTKLTLKEANRLASLPFACIQEEFPNKLNQVLDNSTHLKTPKQLHSSFYGCFDWHSSVHGHWTLVALLKQFPNLQNAKKIKEKLLVNISKENIQVEIDYFKMKGNKSFERTYGWAWLLKLAEELETWDSDFAKKLNANLQPLTNLIVQNYLDYLPKLYYPIRVGEHTNSAFGMSFAYDYAKQTKNEALIKIIETTVERFYNNDQDCPLGWEPSGHDFLSPCFQEADLVRKVYSKEKFKKWLKKFLPQLSNPKFTLEFGKVSDRSDGKLVHLDGLNFSRAWCLYGIAKTLPKYKHLNKVADTHINHSLPSIVDDNYSGTHWLGSFALFALKQAN